MAVEYHVKRTVWVAQCNCDEREPYRNVVAENAPRETMCPKCRNWVPYIQENSQGPEYKTLLTE